jgi:hypothetical protein
VEVRGKVGLLAGTNDGLAIRLNMDFCSRVLEAEAEQASGDDGDWVTFVVYPCEIRHLRVKECSPSHISNARRPKCDSSDGCTHRQIKRHEQRVEFRDSSAKGMTDLQV